VSYFDVYIGDLGDASFRWDGGDWNGNVPVPISPFFPEGGRVWAALVDRIDDGTYDGKQTDFGGYVAKVTKQQIIQFIHEQYTNHDWYRSSGPMPHMYERLQELRRFVDTLDDRKQHALVATEL